MAKVNYYYAIIKPYRQDFIINPKETEIRIMEDHFFYLKSLLKQNKLYIAGPTLIPEDPFGIIILETETEKEAKKLLENDPSVKAGIQIIEDLRPIRLSLTREK
ncbi:MAG: YciI family protein [Candidatus Thorarchaeota archaeon]